MESKVVIFKQFCGAGLFAGADEKVPAPGCRCVNMGPVVAKLRQFLKFWQIQQYFQELKEK